MRTRVFNGTGTAWVDSDGTIWDSGVERTLDPARNPRVAGALVSGLLTDLGAPDAPVEDAPTAEPGPIENEAV